MHHITNGDLEFHSEKANEYPEVKPSSTYSWLDTHSGHCPFKKTRKGTIGEPDRQEGRGLLDEGVVFQRVGGGTY